MWLQRRRTLVSIAMAMGLVLSAGAAAVADTPLTHSGKVGVRYLLDSGEHVGVHCRYNGDQNLHRLLAYPPAVFARDRTAGRDSQWVAVRYELKYRPVAGDWSTVLITGPVKAVAWGDQPAPFRTRGSTCHTR